MKTVVRPETTGKKGEITTQRGTLVEGLHVQNLYPNKHVRIRYDSSIENGRCNVLKFAIEFARLESTGRNGDLKLRSYEPGYVLQVDGNKVVLGTQKKGWEIGLGEEQGVSLRIGEKLEVVPIEKINCSGSRYREIISKNYPMLETLRKLAGALEGAYLHDREMASVFDSDKLKQILSLLFNIVQAAELAGEKMDAKKLEDIKVFARQLRLSPKTSPDASAAL